EIQGLQRYDRSIVVALRPWDASRPKGSTQPYQFSDLLLFQERLRDSGYFNGADVLPDLDAIEADPKRTDIPIKVVLRERRRQRVNFGVGYSTDEGLRALAGYQNRDFLGRGLQLESGLLFQSVSRRVFASVRTPQDAGGHFYQVGARVERLDIQNELTDRQTLFAGRGKHAEEIDSFLSLQYQTEQRTVPLDPASDHRKALTLGYSWNLRRVDSRIDPRRGYTISAQASGAARGLLSDRSFARAWTRAMRFWPMPSESALDGGLVIGLVEAGQVFATSREGIPTENLFRTGGTQSIRGYSYLSLGVPEGGAIVGGRVLGLASVEYQHPIVRDWYGAVFLDAGNAADSWSEWKPVYGTGVGVRWRSPVGPVSVDMAWGEATHQLRFHLSVGYAF
ncbi:MAG: autotransporter assembly complex protein TamA, partial [Gammaproteobacteria bacterium]